MAGRLVDGGSARACLIGWLAGWPGAWRSRIRRVHGLAGWWVGGRVHVLAVGAASFIVGMLVWVGSRVSLFEQLAGWLGIRVGKDAGRQARR